MWKKKELCYGQTTKMYIPAVCDEQRVPFLCSEVDYRIKISHVQEIIIEGRPETKEYRYFRLKRCMNFY